MTSCFLQEKKRKAVIDGVSTLLSVLSLGCFGWVPVSLPWRCCPCVRMLYSALLTDICERSYSFVSAFLQELGVLGVLPLKHC